MAGCLVALDICKSEQEKGYDLEISVRTASALLEPPSGFCCPTDSHHPNSALFYSQREEPLCRHPGSN
jgi:hypothetical protein